MNRRCGGRSGELASLGLWWPWSSTTVCDRGLQLCACVGWACCEGAAEDWQVSRWWRTADVRLGPLG